MLKKYIKETVKRELTKQKLNDIYGSSRTYNLNSVSDKERQELNGQISTLKNYNNNMVERNRYLTLEIDKLKQENEKLNGDKEVLKDALEESNNYVAYLEKENEQLKNLSCTIVVGNDGKLDSLFNQKLKSENEKLKQSIENLEGKLILKGNLLSEQREENEKLKNILNEIHEICDSTWGAKIPYFEVRSLLNKIRAISENALNGENDVIKNISQENEKLKKELRDSKNGLNGANDIIKNMKQENEKLNEKLDGIKHVIKEQRLSALTYEKLKSTFMLIERYLKES